MDDQILANSLVSLKGTDLKMVYALFCRTNIGNLLFSKTKDLLSKEECDHFSKHLEEEVRKIEHKGDQELQVYLLLEITRLLKLRGTKYSLEKEILDQCLNIVNDVYAQFLKYDKKFRSYAEKQSNSSKLQQMVQFQMSKIFNELDDSFQDFSIKDQTKFAAQVNEYIQDLAEEKQKKIKEKLGVDDLTDEMVRKAIATSGTSIVFAVIVEVSGFAFYTTATSLLASFAGLFGLTLPFGFYTGLTSTIAVLANPIFILPLLLGGGALLVNHQNKSLRKKLLPIIVMQIALPFMSRGAASIQFDSFIQEWEERYEKDLYFHDEVKKIESKQEIIRKQIIEKEKLIQEYLSEINTNETLIHNEKQNIKSVLKFTSLDNKIVNDSFRIHSGQYQKNLQDMKVQKQSKKNQTASTGFFQRIGNSISNISTSLDIKEKEKYSEKLLDLMVEDILYSESEFKKNERVKVNTINNDNKQLENNKNTEVRKKRELEDNLSSLNQQKNNYMKQIKKLEKEHYGLEELFV